jgi:hypothetical protein
MALTQLESLHSTREETKFRNMAPVSSPARNKPAAVQGQLVAAGAAVGASNLTLPSFDSDWDSFGPPCESCICLRCGRQLPLLGFQHQQSRQECISNLVLTLGSGHADPFSSLPIEILPSMWPLIDHCKTPTAEFRPLWLEFLIASILSA